MDCRSNARSFFAFLIAWTLCLWIATPPGWAAGYITGLIKDSTGNPILSAYVRAYNRDNYTSNTALSSATGFYKITVNSPGLNDVRAFKEGFIGQYYGGQTYEDENPPRLDVVDGVTLTDITIILIDGGTISGTVTDLSDNPIQSVDIYADVTSTPYPWWNIYTSTDASGNYTLTALPAQSVKVYTYHNDYLQTYYDHKIQWAEAEPLTAGPGTHLTGIDFKLRPGGILRVAVMDASGLPVHDPSTETLLDAHIHDFEQDSSGNLWMACDAGVMGIVAGATLGINPYNSALPAEQVRDISIDPTGTRYYATAFGVAKQSGETLLALNSSNSSLPEDDCTAIAWHPSGVVCIGTQNGVLILWDLSDDTFIYYSAAMRGESSSTPIHAITVNPSEQTVYIGSNAGITKMTFPDSFSNATTADGLPSNEVRAIAIASDGRLWIGTSGGLFLLKESPVSKIAYTTADGLVDNRIQDIFLVNDTHAWIATQGGVSYLASGVFTNYTTSGGLYDNNCLSICVWQGRTYIGQNSGLDVYTSGSFHHIFRQNHYVNLTAYNPESGLSYNSGSSGSLAIDIERMASDQYQLYTSVSGYPRMYYDGVFHSSAATLISVTEGQTTPERYALLLQPYGSLSGSVNDHLGSPLSFGTVYAYSPGDWSNPIQTSVSSGNYQFTSLAPGQYYVAVYNSSYPTQFHAGVYSIADATPISVTSSQETTGIDFQLEQLADTTLTGKIKDAGGQFYAYASVAAQGMVGTSGYYTTSSDASGNYTLTVKPGNYRISAGLPGLPTVYHASTFSSSNADPAGARPGIVNAGKDIQVPNFAPGIIRGLAVDNTGAPVEGVRITCYGGLQYPDQTTGADGRFEFTALPPVTYQLDGLKSGYYAPPTRYVPLASGEVIDPVTLTLTPFTPASLTCVVTNTDGVRLWSANVSISQSGPPYYSDYIATGWTGEALSDSIPVQPTDISISYSGMVTYATTGIPLSAGSNVLTFALDLNATQGAIWGVVRDSGGVPQPGLRVQVSGPTTTTVRTNSLGYYLATQLPTGTYSCQMVDYDSDSTPLSGLSVSAGSAYGNADLTVNRPLGLISGQITTSSPGNSTNYSAYCSPVGHSNYSKYSYVDSYGNYTHCGLVPGLYTVTASLTGFREQYYDGKDTNQDADPVTVQGSQTTTGIDFILIPGEILAGSITDAQGHPIVGGNLQATNLEENRTYYTYSNNFGNYRFDSLLPGDYRAYFSGGNYYYNEYYHDRFTEASADAITVLSGTPRQGIDFAVGFGGSIAGQITDGSGNPYTSGTVYAFYASDTSSSLKSSNLDASGNYLIERLKPGAYYIRANIGGKPPLFYDGAYSLGTATTVSVIEGQQVANIDIAVPQTVVNGTISGTITNPSGSPISGISVRGTGVDGTSGNYSATTATDGSYTLNNVSPGSWAVYIQESNTPPYYYGGLYDQAAATRVVVTPGAAVTGIDIQTAEKHYATVHGTVRDTTGNPIADAQVELDSTYSDYSTTTRPDGTYSFSAVFPTSGYTITASRIPYFATSQSSLSFPAEGDVTIDLTLTEYRPCLAYGCVRNASGSFLSNVYISFTGEDVAYTEYAYTDRYGDYYVPTLPPGKYTIEASLSGYQNQTFTSVSLSPAAPTERHFILDYQPGYGVVTGRVLDATGQPAYGVQVNSQGPSNRNTLTQQDGTYQLPQLNTGTYRIYLSNESDSGNPEQTGIAVTAGAFTENVDFSLSVLYGTIGGTIRDVSGAPIFGANVGANPSGHNHYPGQVTSSTAGTYILPRIRTDGDGGRNYQVHASRSGYAQTYYIDGYESIEAEPVHLNPGGSAENIDMILQPGAGFSGTLISEETGLPITSGTVYARHYYSDTYRNYSTSVLTTGDYTFNSLPPGEFAIYAVSSGYVTEYYPGSPYLADAARITLATGEKKAGYDFELERTASISGTVADQASQPYTFGTVYAYQTDRSFNETYSGNITSPSGQFTLSSLPSGDFYVYAAISGKPKVYHPMAYNPVESVTVAVEPGIDTGGIQITVPQTIENGSIAGVVYTNQGEPYKSVSVRLYGVDGTSSSSTVNSNSSDGSYSFSNLLPGSYVVGLREDNASPYYYGNTYDENAATRLYLDPGENLSGIDITAPPRNDAVVSGTVVDPGLNPVNGAQVSLSWSWSSYSMTTGPDGQFLFPAVFPSDSYSLSSNCIGYYATSQSLTVPEGGTLSGLQIIMTPYSAGLLAGTVTDVSGYPIESAYISLTLGVGTFSTYLYTDRYGQYQFSNLPPGDYSGSCSRSGFDTNNFSGLSIASGVNTIRNFTLNPSSSYGVVSGTVTDASGHPAYRIYVQTNTGYTAYTQSDGKYKIFRVSPGTVTISLPNESAPGNEQTGVVVTAAQETANVDFQLNVAYGIIEGTVRDASGGVPIQGMSVRAQPLAGGSSTETTVTGIDGQYQIGRVALTGTGTYRVWCYGREYVYNYYRNRIFQTHSTPVPIGSSGVASGIDFTMSRGGVFQGQITSSAGGPLGNGYATAYLIHPDGSPSYGQSTNNLGWYRISNLPGGNYKLSFTAPHHVAEYHQDRMDYNSADLIALATATTSTIDAQLTLAATLTGTVSSTLGQGLEGARVYATNTALGSSTSTTADAQGKYTLSGLAPGSYKIRATATGYLPQYYLNSWTEAGATPVSFASGQTRSLNFNLVLGGIVSGQVTNAGGSPITSGTVYAYPQFASGSYSASLDSNGEYRIEGLPGGDYKVRANASDYITVYYDNRRDSALANLVTIATGEATPAINFMLYQGGSLSGTVKNEAASPYTSGTVYLSLPSNPGNSVYSAGINSSGQYSFSAIWPDEYYSFVQISGKPRIFYPYSFSIADASKVTIPEGGSLSDIHYVVPQNVESATLAGRVTRDGSGFYCRVYRKGVDGYTGQSSTWTNSETGEFTMTSVSAGTYLLYADVDNAPPYYYGNTENESTATRIALQPGQTRSNLSIELPLTPPNYARVSGTVYDNLSRPLPLAQVSLSTVESYSVLTAMDGTFLFSQVLAGSNYQLSASKPGHYSQTRTGIDITAGAVLTGQDFTLTAYAGGEAAGIVRNASGLALVNAYASINGVNVSYSAGMSADLNGEYYFPNLPPGEYNLAFSITGYQGLNLNGIQILAGQTTIHDVTMAYTAGKGMVSGTVRDASGNPACQIFVQNRTGSYTYFTTGPDGRFLLAGIDPTDSFEAYCPYETGQPGVSGLPVFADGITEGADIVLQNTYTTVSGKVTDATGTPVYYASVSGQAVSGNSPGSVYTNRLGNYRMGRVRTEGGRSYRVYASKEGWVRTYYGGTPRASLAWIFDALPGDTEIPGIDMALLDGGSISGAVMSSAGTLLPNVQVYFRPDDTEFSSPSFYTDAGGRYLARGLAAGSYKVRAKLDNWAAQYYSGQPTSALADSVNVAEGIITSGIDFLLSEGGSIAGRVVNTSGIPLDSVTVYVDSAQQTECSGNDKTNASGQYTVVGLYTDTYRVRAQKTGYTTAYQYSVSVVDAETTSDIDFVLYRTDESTPTPTPTITPTHTPDPNATPTQKPGDFNTDGDVDPADLILLIDNLFSGQSDHDLNGDGIVDYKDFLKFSTLWGQ